VSVINGYILLEPSSQLIMNLLGLLWGGCLSGADGPDRLVCDDHIAPVADTLSDGGKLTLIDGLSLSSFSLLKLLTNASYHLKIIIKGDLNLVSND
jgi:hypothetical protein